MKLTEESMKVLEAGIPKLAEGAFRQAYDQALATSGQVMRAVNGRLVVTYADGSEMLVRAIHSPYKVTAGAKFKLKRRVTAAG